VLLAAFGSVFALLGVSQLYPGKPSRCFPEVTNDLFVIAIAHLNASQNAAHVAAILSPCNPVELVEYDPQASL
jgi:hypothetical protein